MKEPESHTPESSKPKRTRYKRILKWVLFVVNLVWRAYRFVVGLEE